MEQADTQPGRGTGHADASVQTSPTAGPFELRLTATGSCAGTRGRPNPDAVTPKGTLHPSNAVQEVQG